MADKKTLRLLNAGTAIASGDLFLSRQGADVEDVSVTIDQFVDFMDDSGVFVARAGDSMIGALNVADLSNALNSGDYPVQSMSGVTADGTGVGFAFDTVNNLLTTTGDRVVDFRTGGVEVLHIEKSDSVGKTLRVAVNRGDFGVGGLANVITGNSWVFGQGHTASATNGLVVGQQNTIAASYSVAIGFGNSATTNGSIAMGLSNTVAGAFYNTGIGFSNTVGGFGCVGLGLSNVVGGAGFVTCAAIGQSNTIMGSGSSAFGSSNVDNGNVNSILIGSVNSTTASNTVILGRSNSASGSEALIFGSNSKNAGLQSLASGFNLNLTNDGSVLIGSGYGVTDTLGGGGDGTLALGVKSTLPTFVMTPSVVGGGVGDIGFIGLGTTVPVERLDVAGNIKTRETFIASTDTTALATYTITTEHTLSCTATCTVSLPATPKTGQIHNVRHNVSTAATITVSGNGNNINGLTTQSIGARYSTVTVQFDGTEWMII